MVIVAIVRFVEKDNEPLNREGGSSMKYDYRKTIEGMRVIKHPKSIR